VDKHVALEFTEVGKRIGADGTAVFIVGTLVQSHVPLQRVEPDELLIANATLVRLLLRVRPVVTAQLRNGRELLAAVVANVRLHAEMDSHVQTQISGDFKSPMAHSTRVRLFRRGFVVGCCLLTIAQSKRVSTVAVDFCQL